MTIVDADHLDHVRRQLDVLAARRLASGLNPSERHRYQELCLQELRLLSKSA